MKNKKILVSCLLLTALTIVIVPLVKREFLPSRDKIELESINPEVPIPVLAFDRESPEANFGEQVLWSDIFSPADDFDWDSRKEAERATALPFTLAGLGTKSARVIDTTGEIVMESSITNQIHELKVSPNMKRIAVGWGNGISVLFDSETREYIELPGSPGGPEMLGFDLWVWLTDDLIMTTSGVISFDLAGESITGGEEPVIERTQVYVYRLSTRSINPVSKPESIHEKVFRIKRVSSNGCFELVSDGTHGSSGRDVGWYRARMN